MNNEIINFYNNYLDRLKTENNRHRRIFKSIDEFISLGNVLDIGCGTGITSRYLAKGGRDVVAVDISPKLIEYAEKLNSHFGRVKYVCADICDLTINKSFDSILIVDVLEHILPEKIDDLFNAVKLNSHKSTKIYLNIPHENVIRYLKKNKPEILQIVDNPVDIKYILQWFDDIGFVPSYFNFYWQQYVEYLFVTKEVYNKTLQKAFV